MLIEEENTAVLRVLQESELPALTEIEYDLAARQVAMTKRPFTLPANNGGYLYYRNQQRLWLSDQVTMHLPVIGRATTPIIPSTSLPELPRRPLLLPADTRPEYATPTLNMTCPEERPAGQKRTMSFATVVICLLTALVFLLLVLIVAVCAFRYGGGTLR